MMGKESSLLIEKSSRKTFLPYGHQWIDDGDIGEVASVLKSDFITQGEKIQQFEQAIAKYCNVKYATVFSSGTAALHAAAYVSGLKTGDEAITTPITFASTGNCALFMGADVKFADIKKNTYNIDPAKIIHNISDKTKVILPVDFAGQPCDLDEINDIAQCNDLTVIEDASHALGAEYKGKKIGCLSDLTVFSFHPVKIITTGEGGMVLTNNVEFKEKLELFRSHGITKDPEKMKRFEGDWYYEMQNLGYNYRITDFQCALGLSQLKKLDGFIKRRREIAQMYSDAFADMDQIVTPEELPNNKSVYHLYVILLNLEKLIVDRKIIFDVLRSQNIGVHVHYIPLHLHPYYSFNFGFKHGDFPVSEDYYQRALTLPIFPKMNDDDVGDVIVSIKNVINKYKK